MTNMEVALILKEIASFLELKEENYYKIRAYSRGARVIEKHPENIVRLVQENRLGNVDGIGKKLAAQVSEIILTGRCSILEDLKKEFPPFLRSILGIPGVGAKTARTISKNLQINSLKELKDIAGEGKIKQLPGLGKNTEEKILHGINKLEKQKQKTLLGLALPFANTLLENLKNLEKVDSVELAGSIRRKEERVKDIDLVVMTSQKKEVKDKLVHLNEVRQVIKEEENRISFINIIGLKVDVFLLSKSKFYTALLYLTGNEAHVSQLEHIAKQRGYKLTPEGLITGEDEKAKNFVELKSEKDIYTELGLLFVPPEIREGEREVRLAREKSIPDLIEEDVIQGDLHVHTYWSDGADSIEEMVLRAVQKDYEYIAITDHSRSLRIAGGLEEKELMEQVEEIKKLNDRFNGQIKILSGIEADVLNDGTLDYSGEILKTLDFVIASIHQDFRMEKDQMTSRLLKAMENPYVRVLGHPMGRLINKRESHDLDLEAIFKKAAETKTALEINSSIDRLDLPYYFVKKAKSYGIKFVVNTDAHDVNRLDTIKFGVFVARKGYLEKSQVINTYDLENLLKWLETKPGRGKSEG